MPIYEFECHNGHITEKLLSFSELDELERNEAGDGIVICTEPLIPVHGFDEICQCIAKRVYRPKKAIYNAHGFYGNIPTDMAHNTGAV